MGTAHPGHIPLSVTEQAGQVRADPLPHEDQRLFASATHPPDQAIPRYRATGAPTAHRQWLFTAIYRSRHPPARSHGRTPQHPQRVDHEETLRTRLYDVWSTDIPTPGLDLRGAPVQPEEGHRLCCYRRHVEKTRPRVSRIGERRKPWPNGQPGYIRIDTVHQGDWDGQKGVYHVNAVDEVTQVEMVVSVEKISERYLIPALEQLLDDFPFIIQGFHSDNGSEYVNGKVAGLLEKLRAEFTKSRSRQTNDNALAESKNGHVVRKIFGHDHIPQHWAAQINEFNRQHLNPYINYHRPACSLK